MSLKNIKKFNINLIALTFVIFLLFAYFVGSSFAWFTDNSNFEEEDEVAQIEVELLSSSNQPITTAPYFIYNGAATNDLVVKVKNTNTSSIDAIARVMIVATWSNGAPVYETEMGHSVTYSFDNANWIAAEAGSGYDYFYYDGVIAHDTIVNFLTSISFPTLPSIYDGESLIFYLYVEGLQANAAGVTLWSENAPAGWAPLS
jgi:hypothetical protein